MVHINPRGGAKPMPYLEGESTYCLVSSVACSHTTLPVPYCPVVLHCCNFLPLEVELHIHDSPIHKYVFGPICIKPFCLCKQTYMC